MGRKHDLSKADPIKNEEYYWAKAVFKDPLFKQDVKNNIGTKEMADKYVVDESIVESYMTYGKDALDGPPPIIVAVDEKSEIINIQIGKDFRKENLIQCWPIIEAGLKKLPGYKESLKYTSTADLPYGIFRAMKFYGLTKPQVYNKMQDGTLLPKGKKVFKDYSDFVKFFDEYVKGKLTGSK